MRSLRPADLKGGEKKKLYNFLWGSASGASRSEHQ